MLLMLKLILHLLQENKSYGVKTICIHPLMSHRCTSHHHVWHNSNLDAASSEGPDDETDTIFGYMK
jgi:hypothetical protein